jgi:hypothetical protein
MTLKDVGGTVLQSLVGAIFGWYLATLAPSQAHEWIQVGVLLVVLILLSVMTFYSHQIYLKIVQPQPRVAILQAGNSDRNEFFDIFKKAIAEAHKSIIAITYHVDVPDPKEDGLEAYYSEIERVIGTMQQENKDFKYTRIYQMPSKTTPIEESTIGKRGYRHLDRLSDNAKSNALSKVKVHFLHTDLQIQSSILLIDNTDAYVGLPQRTSKGIILSTSIHIHDESGNLLEPFYAIAEDIGKDSIPYE